MDILNAKKLLDPDFSRQNVDIVKKNDDLVCKKMKPEKNDNGKQDQNLN